MANNKSKSIPESALDTIEEGVKEGAGLIAGEAKAWGDAIASVFSSTSTDKDVDIECHCGPKGKKD